MLAICESRVLILLLSIHILILGIFFTLSIRLRLIVVVNPITASGSLLMSTTCRHVILIPMWYHYLTVLFAFPLPFSVLFVTLLSFLSVWALSVFTNLGRQLLSFMWMWACSVQMLVFVSIFTCPSTCRCLDFDYVIVGFFVTTMGLHLTLL